LIARISTSRGGISKVVMSQDPSVKDGNSDLRPFRVEASQHALDDLRRRIAATRRPSRELVPGRSQGIQLATMQALAHFWTDDHDWRRAEAKLNALPSSRPRSMA
jgi:hypothetical protein